MNQPHSSKFAPVKAIYFDLDDTLCGYWDASKAGLTQAFAQHGPAGFTPEEMKGHWGEAFRKFSPTLKATHWYEEYLTSGQPTRTEQMRLTLKEVGIEDEELAQNLSETYMVERDKALSLFHDAIEVLEALKGKYPLGLITNGPADIQRQEINTLKIGHYFDNIYIEGELRIGKPAPIVFEKARAAVGVEPHEILMVGNSYGHDIAAAITAGWQTAWIRRPSDVPPSARFSGEPEVLPPGSPQPTLIIHELSELLPELL